MGFFSSPPLKTSVGKDCKTISDRVRALGNKPDSSEVRAQMLVLAAELDSCDRKSDGDLIRSLLASLPPVGTAPGSGGGEESSSAVPVILVGGIFAATMAYIILGDHK